jgi:hypothetical protein
MASLNFSGRRSIFISALPKKKVKACSINKSIAVTAYWRGRCSLDWNTGFGTIHTVGITRCDVLTMAGSTIILRRVRQLVPSCVQCTRRSPEFSSTFTRNRIEIKKEQIRWHQHNGTSDGWARLP